VRTVLNGTYATLCCPDSSLGDHTRPAHDERAFAFRLTDQKIGIAIPPAMLDRIAETQHTVPVSTAHAEGPHLDIALDQRFGEFFARDLPLLGCQHNALTLHQSL
jgi:hypothetical protein